MSKQSRFVNRLFGRKLRIYAVMLDRVSAEQVIAAYADVASKTSADKPDIYADAVTGWVEEDNFKAAQADAMRALKKKMARLEPRCTRCEKGLISEIAVDTGICAECWLPEDNFAGEQI